MDDASAGEQPLELEKVRRRVRILVDLGRAASDSADLNRFLDQAVLHVARALEIGHGFQASTPACFAWGSAALRVQRG